MSWLKGMGLLEKGKMNMLLKGLYLFMKFTLVFMMLVLIGIIVALVPFIYLCIVLKIYSFIVTSLVLLPVCFYGIYHGFKGFRSLTLKSLQEQLPFLKK